MGHPSYPFPKFTPKRGTAFELQEGASPVGIELARVVYVDYEQLLVDVVLINQSYMLNGISNFLSTDATRTADAGSLPSVNSVVLVGLISKAGASQEWAILGMVKGGYRSGQALIATRNHPADPQDNILERQITRKISPKEFQISSEAGGEALIDEGWSFLTKDLAEVKTDCVTETQVFNYHNVSTQSFGGRSQSGAAVRMLPNTSGPYAHPTGLSFQYVTLDGLDPALRYKDGSTPGLVAVEEVHVFHESTDLIPDLTPQLHGVMPVHTYDFNEVSNPKNTGGTWAIQSSDRPPNTQDVTHPLEENQDRAGDPNQILYTGDAISIQQRRDLRYTHDSNLIGMFEADPARYLSVLVPQINISKFSADFFHTQVPLQESHPHPNFRLRVPVRSEYSPLIYNQTAYYQTKEGYQIWVMGATLDSDNSPVEGAVTFQKGAGRSGEIYTFGGLEALLGKTQDEEESLSLITMGQVFAHLGADSGEAPHNNRSIMALDRMTGQNISLELYDFTPILRPGDSENYLSKTGAENLSMILTTDGGVSARFGARNAAVRRKFVYNGTSDGQGGSVGPTNCHNANRKTYGSGDGNYQFHDLSETANSNADITDLMSPLNLGATDLSGYDPDTHGRSWDFHLCADWFMRIGSNPDSGTSWSMDTDGGLVWWLGADMNGRSLTIQTDGGAQISLNADPDGNGEALNLRINGNVNEYITGSVNRIIGGDLTETIEGSRVVQITGNDTLLVGSIPGASGVISHICQSYNVLCSMNGLMAFGTGLNFAVTGIAEFEYTGLLKETVYGSSTTSVIGGVTTQSYMGALSTTITGPHTITANSVVFTCSAAFSLKSAGAVSIGGTALVLNGSGTATLSSSGLTTVSGSMLSLG